MFPEPVRSDQLQLLRWQRWTWHRELCGFERIAEPRSARHHDLRPAHLLGHRDELRWTNSEIDGDVLGGESTHAHDHLAGPQGHLRDASERPDQLRLQRRGRWAGDRELRGRKRFDQPRNAQHQQPWPEYLLGDGDQRRRADHHQVGELQRHRPAHGKSSSLSLQRERTSRSANPLSSTSAVLISSPACSRHRQAASTYERFDRPRATLDTSAVGQHTYHGHCRRASTGSSARKSFTYLGGGPTDGHHHPRHRRRGGDLRGEPERPPPFVCSEGLGGPGILRMPSIRTTTRPAPGTSTTPLRSGTHTYFVTRRSSLDGLYSQASITYDVVDPVLVAHQTSGSAGQTVSFTVGGFATNETVDFSMYGAKIGSVHRRPHQR